MSVVTVHAAKTNLSRLLARVEAGEEIVIVQAGQALATLTRSAQTIWPCQAGSAKDLPHWMAPDFNDMPGLG